MESSMNERSRSREASMDALTNDVVTAEASISQRSTPAGQPSEDAGPLLGLEPATIEKTAQNSVFDEDSNRSARLAPLLGTISKRSWLP
jgi:hypothetical protein